jgi:hypothetical protein
MTRSELLAQVALGEVGTTESPPGSNRTKYGAEYGMNGVPWCAIFIWWCARRAGLPCPDTAYVPHLEQWARDYGYTVPAAEIRRGDVVCLDFTDPWGDGSDHVEIALGPPHGGLVACVGGNTSDTAGGSVDNGGGVYQNTRPVAWIATAIRLPGSNDTLDEEDPMMTTWTVPDGRRYLRLTTTGAAPLAVDALPAGADIEGTVAELVRTGACKDLGAVTWESNWVLRTAHQWVPA